MCITKYVFAQPSGKRQLQPSKKSLSIKLDLLVEIPLVFGGFPLPTLTGTTLITYYFNVTRLSFKYYVDEQAFSHRFFNFNVTAEIIKPEVKS